VVEGWTDHWPLTTDHLPRVPHPFRAVCERVGTTDLNRSNAQWEVNQVVEGWTDL